jgi:hypothetical protein
MPLVMDDRWGFMLRAIRRPAGFDATAISQCGFVLANGFRTKSDARDLKKALTPLRGKLPALRSLHVGPIPKSARRNAFFIGRDYWLSKR